jgi:hypothetical protein
LYNKAIPKIKNPLGIDAKIKYFNAEVVLNLFLRSNPTKTYELKAMHSNKIIIEIKSVLEIK